MKPVSIRIVVDLPAPLGPRNPRTSPRSTAKLTSSTAVTGPKRFASLSSLTISCTTALRVPRLEAVGPRSRVGPTARGGPGLDGTSVTRLRIGDNAEHQAHFNEDRSQKGNRARPRPLEECRKPRRSGADRDGRLADADVRPIDTLGAGVAFG